MRDFSRRFYLVPAAIALALVGLALRGGTARPGASPKPNHHRFAVATEHPLATRVGLETLRRGGNAVDAAIAIALTLGVVEPASSGIGGGGFALVWEASRSRMTALDFREVAPGALDPALLEYRSKQPFASGRGRMIGVPGEVAGLVELHRRFARRALAEDVAPAVEAAERGFYVSEHLATMTRAYHAELEWSSPLRALLKPGGWPAQFGQRLVNAPLAGTLQRIGAEGSRAFYEGRVADEIVAAAQRAGSALAHADLRAYRVVEREPLGVSWEGHTVFTMPPPSAGGLLVAETLGMFGRRDLEQLQLGTGAYDHLLAETFRSAITDRMNAIGDPAFVDPGTSRLLHVERLRDQRAHIALDRTRPSPKLAIREHGTTHFIVVDDEGNVVSMTSTVNNAFGARVSTETTGVLLNDQLDDFTTRSASSFFSSGAVPSSSVVPTASSSRQEPNEPRPFARPTSSMTPTIVVRDGRAVLAVGGSGGLRIATGVAQALLSRLVFQRPVADCVAAPRVHTPMDEARAVLELEEDAAPALVEDLRARGESVRRVPNYSAVQMIAIEHDAHGGLAMTAASDPRKGGSADVE